MLSATLENIDLYPRTRCLPRRLAPRQTTQTSYWISVNIFRCCTRPSNGAVNNAIMFVFDTMFFEVGLVLITFAHFIFRANRSISVSKFSEKAIL